MNNSFLAVDIRGEAVEPSHLDLSSFDFELCELFKHHESRYGVIIDTRVCTDKQMKECVPMGDEQKNAIVMRGG